MTRPLGDDAGRGTAGFPAVFYSRGKGTVHGSDNVTVEEPLEIRMQNRAGETRSIAVTMRTPGMDSELAAGFLFTEGIIHGNDDVISIGRPEEGGDRGNIIVITVSDDAFNVDPEYRRNFTMNSSCGVCGKSSINQVFVRGTGIMKSGMRIDAGTLLGLPGIMRNRQELFSRTGGIHAAGLFSPGGELIMVAEDVGRHNTMDKIAGRLLLDGRLPPGDAVVQFSGRAGFEMVQKAVVAGIPVISSVSAPSSLAVETADTFGATLVCFVRGDRFNVYTHGERISFPGSPDIPED